MEKAEKEKILQELGGLSAEIYDSLCAEHLEQTKTRCTHIAQALEKDNLEAVGDLAHSIKGASGNLRLHALFESALALERSAKDGQSKEEVRAKYQQLEECLQSLMRSE